MSKRTDAMKLAAMVALALAAMPGVGPALTRFPPGGTGKTASVEALLQKAAPGQEKIRIDDMVFRVDTLEKSGYTGDPWPGGVVYYQFDSGLSSAQRDSVRAAVALWSQVANLTFIEGVGPDPFNSHIYIFDDGEGNWSEVGWQLWPQEMSLTSWASTGLLYLIAHEFCHALGFKHEHQRTDRDTYVAINFDNIIDDKEHNFEMSDAVNLTPYDFDSVMHYSACAFVWDFLPCPPNFSIIVNEPWQGEWQLAIGQRDHLSDYDIEGMSNIYGAPCHGPIFVHSVALPIGANGSLAHPFPLLAQALGFACDGAEIRLFAGSQPYAPVTIGQHVVLSSHGGSAVIE